MANIPQFESLQGSDIYKYDFPLANASDPVAISIHTIIFTQPMKTSNLIVAKLSAVAILGFGSLFLGLFPILLRRKNTAESSLFRSITSIMMFFGGGVLLSTTFLHLLPEVQEQIEALKKDNILFPDKDFPFGECIMCIGFFMMFSIESFIHTFMKSGPTHVHEAQNINVKTTNYKTCNEDVQVVDPTEPHPHNHTHEHSHHDHSHDHSQMLRSGSLRNFLIVMALSIHELFEGLAVGLEQVPTQVWYLLLAVACHKFVIALCLGLQITNNTVGGNKKLFMLNIMYVVVFALCSPLGITIGMFITMYAAESSSSILLTILSVILQGIATGTLLYVVFFEILKPREHDASRARVFFSLLFLLLGFVLMAFFQYVLGE